MKGTFFTLGWVAERAPKLIRKIVDAGHELASHGYDHKRVFLMDATEFAADLAKATATGDYSHTAMAALSTSTATTRPATTARATAASTHRATATLTPASTATAAMTGTATATATIERS